MNTRTHNDRYFLPSVACDTYTNKRNPQGRLLNPDYGCMVRYNRKKKANRTFPARGSCSDGKIFSKISRRCIKIDGPAYRRLLGLRPLRAARKAKAASTPTTAPARKAVSKVKEAVRNIPALNVPAIQYPDGRIENQGAVKKKVDRAVTRAVTTAVNTATRNAERKAKENAEKKVAEEKKKANENAQKKIAEEKKKAERNARLAAAAIAKKAVVDAIRKESVKVAANAAEAAKNKAVEETVKQVLGSSSRVTRAGARKIESFVTAAANASKNATKEAVTETLKKAAPRAGKSAQVQVKKKKILPTPARRVTRGSARLTRSGVRF
ncbi:hypothetical protein EBT31_13185 [bacterium]|jgi:hypothetical protein|nr:hypothetical protein [bacterium]